MFEVIKLNLKFHFQENSISSSKKNKAQQLFANRQLKKHFDRTLVSYDASEAGTNGVIVTLDLLKNMPVGQAQNFVYIVDKGGSMFKTACQ